MKLTTEMTFMLVSGGIFIILLVVFAMYIPRLIQGKKEDNESTQINTVMSAFGALGDEIKSLKTQLAIKERLAALGEISAGIAHELRNPMAVIAGYARILVKEASGGTQRNAAQGILNEIEEMNKVIEELLKFSKSDSIEKTSLDLAKIVRDLVETMDKRSVKINIPVSENFYVRGDETLLRQALRNLITNGVDSGGDVEIGLRDEKPVRNGVMITVSDNGKGIDEPELSKIFMPFYTTKEKGLGIGLALVHKIITVHGGTINVESTEGKGSVFKCFLPAE
ncbi:MAG: hypothetical protein EPN22_02405 [Nitrospirae bacterium]|nr:MAG: hypothetical protein EPN22_02405 [Nitrospirota bacterium]